MIPTTLADYAPRLSNRLLAGAGLMQITTHRIPVLSHGFAEDATVSITCRELDVAHLPDRDIEFEIGKQALEWDTTMAVASLHGKAQIRWSPGAGPTRTGRLELSELTLHWPAGSTHIDLDSVDATTVPLDEFAVHEAIAAVGRERLGSLQEMVHLGLCEGVTLSDTARPLCCHLRHRTWIGDVDRSGIMVVSTNCERVVTTLVSMSAIAENEADLARLLTTS